MKHQRFHAGAFVVFFINSCSVVCAVINKTFGSQAQLFPWQRVSIGVLVPGHWQKEAKEVPNFNSITQIDFALNNLFHKEG